MEVLKFVKRWLGGYVCRREPPNSHYAQLDLEYIFCCLYPFQMTKVFWRKWSKDGFKANGSKTNFQNPKKTESYETTQKQNFIKKHFVKLIVEKINY